MKVIINNRPVRVTIEWSVSCVVKTKKGKLWRDHHATCYAENSNEVHESLQCKLKKSKHTVIKINYARPSIAFAYYADVDILEFADDALLKNIVIPEPIKPSQHSFTV